MSPSLLVGDDRVHADLPPEVLAAVYAAVAPACTTDITVPPFGSWSWCALAEDDPARDFATVRAAFAWFLATTFGAGIPASVLDREISRALRDASHAVSAAANWRAIASRPTRAQVQQWRAQARPLVGAVA